MKKIYKATITYDSTSKTLDDLFISDKTVTDFSISVVPRKLVCVFKNNQNILTEKLNDMLSTAELTSAQFIEYEDIIDWGMVQGVLLANKEIITKHANEINWYRVNSYKYCPEEISRQIGKKVATVYENVTKHDSKPNAKDGIYYMFRSMYDIRSVVLGESTNIHASDFFRIDRANTKGRRPNLAVADAFATLPLDLKWLALVICGGIELNDYIDEELTNVYLDIFKCANDSVRIGKTWYINHIDEMDPSLFSLYGYSADIPLDAFSYRIDEFFKLDQFVRKELLKNGNVNRIRDPLFKSAVLLRNHD